jgi:hypothetical protein
MLSLAEHDAHVKAIKRATLDLQHLLINPKNNPSHHLRAILLCLTTLHLHICSRLPKSLTSTTMFPPTNHQPMGPGAEIRPDEVLPPMKASRGKPVLETVDTVRLLTSK